MKEVRIAIPVLFVMAWVLAGCGLTPQPQTTSGTSSVVSASTPTSTYSPPTAYGTTGMAQATPTQAAPATLGPNQLLATVTALAQASTPTATTPASTGGIQATPGAAELIATLTAMAPAANQPAAPMATTAVTPFGGTFGSEPAKATDPSLASELLDAEISDASGARLAKVDSLLINRAAGQIVYVFLKTNTELEGADQVAPIPWGALQVTDDVNDTLDRVTFKLNPSILASAPTMVVSDTFNFNTPGWDSQVAGYWNSQAVAMLPNTGPSSSASLARVKDVGDLRLTNPQGVEIAKVKEAELDPATGQLRYVIVKLESETNPVNEYIPIPFEKISWNNPNEEFLLLTADPALLVSAPGYPTEEAIPDTAAPGWDTAVKQFWAGK